MSVFDRLQRPPNYADIGKHSDAGKPPEGIEYEWVPANIDGECPNCGEKLTKAFSREWAQSPEIEIDVYFRCDGCNARVIANVKIEVQVEVPVLPPV